MKTMKTDNWGAREGPIEIVTRRMICDGCRYFVSSMKLRSSTRHENYWSCTHADAEPKDGPCNGQCKSLSAIDWRPDPACPAHGTARLRRALQRSEGRPIGNGEGSCTTPAWCPVRRALTWNEGETRMGDYL